MSDDALRQSPGSSPAPPARVWQRARAIARSRALWAVLAALAITLLALRLRAPSSTSALPAYEVTLARGADEPAARTETSTRSHDRLSIVLRPASSVGGDVEVTVFGMRGAEVQRANAAARVSPVGVVEVAGRARDFVGDGLGEAAIVVVIARAGHPPPTNEEVSSGHPSPGARVTRIDLTVLP